ncbi:hypothetical protein [Cellulomonas sp. Leaf334]|uniref:hypothetical protein n=1 Tax=Cellulomonas sp. Leaf334 TaxID=1736339 RepID=UPI0006FDB9D9|nr:hypothetical protein [Cellulomonas sp. Leaf334]KQR07728.1 hypothetical protein ASF78_20880 [Cellulomonas sp. Leaf334]
MSVRGPRAIAVLCARCLAVLVVVNLLGLAVAYAVMGSDVAAGSVVAAALAYFPAVATIAALLIAVVGFPAGLLAARLLSGQRREGVHVLVFASVGALLAMTLCGWWGMLGITGWAWFVAAAEGAVGAGGARWWSGRAHARAVPWSDVQGAALPWGKIGP